MSALLPMRAQFTATVGRLVGTLIVAIVVLAACSADTSANSRDSTEAEPDDAPEPPAVLALSDDPTTTAVVPPPPRSLGRVTAADATTDVDTRDGEDAQTDERLLADLQVGDCVDLPVAPPTTEESDGEKAVDADPADDEVAFATLIPCDEPHDAEVYARISLDDDPDAEHPGDDAVLAGADRVCLEAFEGYIGVPYVDTRLEVVHLRPNEAAWVRGDRIVVCAVVSIDLEPLVGSVRSEA